MPQITDNKVDAATQARIERTTNICRTPDEAEGGGGNAAEAGGDNAAEDGGEGINTASTGFRFRS